MAKRLLQEKTTMRKMKTWLLLIWIAFAANTVRSETVVDFEELSGFDGTPPSGTGEFFNGYGAGANNAGFISQGVTFTTGEFGPGWSYSDVNNTTTPGSFNQYAAFPGGGANAAGATVIGNHYGLVNTHSNVLPDGSPDNGAHLNFSTMVQLQSVDLANTTYVARFVIDGLDGRLPDFSPTNNPAADFDAAAQFGDGDFFRVTITGFDSVNATGAQTGQVAIDMANYGGAGAGDDFFQSDWLRQDLSGFGLTRSLRFATSSSKFTDFGGGFVFSDVPAYAAVDNLSFTTVVPEPSSGFVICVGCVLLVAQRRRRNAFASLR